MFFKDVCKTGLLCAALLTAGTVNAALVYEVTSTPKINCGNDPHGLWTNKYGNSGCQEYYDFLAGSTLTVDGVTAVLDATAMNEAGNIATINITFEGYQDIYSPTKEGGGVDYQPGPVETPNWDFYTYVTNGTISFSNGDSFTALLVGQPGPGVASGNKPVLQIGLGANDKSSGFGASTWLDMFVSDTGEAVAGHWDLNMNLTAGNLPPNEVPVPGTLALFCLGLFGLMRRKR